MSTEMVEQEKVGEALSSGMCTVPVVLLQRWALALSQGDSRVRHEIEQFLQGKGLPLRDPLS